MYRRQFFHQVSSVCSLFKGTSLGETLSKGTLLCPSRWARQLATSLKAGQTLILKDKLFTILKATHTQGTGRQIGNVQLELRDVKTHLKHNERLRSSAVVDVAFLTSQKWNVLYTEKDNVVCIHPETYEQITIPRAVFGAQGAYLDGGMEAEVGSYNGEPVIASLPTVVSIAVQSVDAEVGEGVRSATLASGKVLRLPAYVQAGDVISVNTKDGSFVKRLQS